MKKILVGIFGLFFTGGLWAATLPAGYTELEYIQSTGGQYVDTGVARGSSNFVVEYDINMVTANGARFAFSGASWNVSSYLAFDKSDNTFDVGQGTTESVQGALNTRYKLKAEYKVGSIVLSLYDNNGTLLASATRTNNSWVSSNTASWLFGTVRDIPSGTGFSYTLKSFGGKIWQGTTLIRDFVPAKNSSGVVGMYDTVNNVFYTNQGTGEFTAGPVVLNPCRNLFDKNQTYLHAYVNSDTGILTQGTTQYSFVVPVKPNTKYTLTGSGSAWGSFTSNAIGITATHLVRSTGGSSNGTITTGPNDRYLIGMTYATGTQYDYRDTLQIEEGDTATAYVPYNASCHNTNPIKIATTAYNTAQFSPVVTDLNSTIATIRDVVTNTINQTKAIADLQATKQTRPDENCPAGKKCLLVEDDAGQPHWYEIIESAD